MFKLIESVFLIGASGRVGAQTAFDLAEKGIHVYAGARHMEHIIQHNNITPVKLDIATAAVDEMTELFKDVDGIVFTAGSKGQDLLRVDAFGAVKSMQAAEAAGATRFVILSSLYALEPERWAGEPFKSAAEDSLTEFNIAKFFADRYLIDNTTLDYTILQPGFLTDGPYTGKITTNVENSTYENSIADVAATLAEIVINPSTKKRVIKMSQGSIPIIEALK